MEIEKLIKHMREEAQDYRSGRTLGRAFVDAEDVLDEAATALEQLQAENDRLRRERNEAVIDMTALMAGQCCDLCAVEHCIVRGNTEMCATFKWRGPKEGSHD